MKTVLQFQLFFGILVALIVLPAICTGLMVYAYGVDGPYWDEWELIGPMRQWNNGTLTWPALFVQHNEHRIFFPRIIMVAAANWTSWNTRVEMAIIWLLTCGCSFNLWRISQATGWRNSRLGMALLVGANILLFTPIAWEDWIWGFQIGFLLPLTCITAALWIVPTAGPRLALVSAFLLSTICTFSIASGFMCWLLILPLYLFPEGKFCLRDRIPGCVVWLCGLVGSVSLYLHGYYKPPAHPSVWLAEEHPILALSYFLAYLGAPFGYGYSFLNGEGLAILMGAIMLGLFVGVVLYLGIFWRDSGLRNKTFPWLMLALVTIFSSILSMIGRMGFGTDQAMCSRYIPFAVMLPVALLFLIASIYQHGQKQAPAIWSSRTRSALSILGVVALGLNLSATLFTLPQWQHYRQDRLLEKALIETIHMVQRPEIVSTAVYPISSLVPAWVDTMSKFGYLRPPMLTSNLVSLITPAGISSTDSYGYIDELKKAPDGKLSCQGWAVLPSGHRSADAVLLTYDDDTGQATIFDLAATGLRRPDVAKTLRSGVYSDSGFSTILKTDHVPPGPRTIRAWAFDSEKAQAFPLKGQTIVVK